MNRINWIEFRLMLEGFLKKPLPKNHTNEEKEKCK
jgi:hypothetical protein